MTLVTGRTETFVYSNVGPEAWAMALERVCLEVEVGSRLHGLAMPETDDQDLMGVFVGSPGAELGVARQVDSVVLRTVPEGHRSGPGDTDLVLYSLRHFCRLAAAGNPTVLQVLWAPEPAVRHENLWGEALVTWRHVFLHRGIAERYHGYMRAQLSRLLGGPGKRVNRPELVDRFGFDTKYACNVLRLGYQGIELLQHHALTLPMREASQQHLLSVRAGGVPLQDIVEEAEALSVLMRAAASTTTLPDRPRLDLISELCATLYRSAWDEDAVAPLDGYMVERLREVCP